VSGSAHEWKDLEASLDGAFSARAKGFLGTEFSLSGRDGFGFGSLRLEGSEEATFEAEELSVRVEGSGSTYRMYDGSGEVLSAGRETSGLRVERDGVRYEASVSLFRNTASARFGDGREAARASGGISNRRYEASFEEGSLPVAVFLLFHLATTRRRAFRAGAAKVAGR
jgi:hypothetical protein